MKSGIKQRDRTTGSNNGKNEKIKIAKELLKLNIPIEQIMQITKLTKEEIEK